MARHTGSLKYLQSRLTATTLLGLAVIVAAFFLRQLVELALVADGRIDSRANLILIGLGQLAGTALGVFVIARQPRLRSVRWSSFMLPVGSTLLTLLAVEVGARLWLAYLATPEQVDRYALFTSIEPENYAWTPHHYLGYYPTPNFQNGQTSHNSLGFRGSEFALEKPEDVYRIVALGGSSTYDVRIANNAETFTAHLEALLNEKYGRPRIEVINAGVPGYNSWEILVNLEFRVLDLDPDLVIMYEGTNDVHARLVEPSAYRGDNSGRRHFWQVPPVPLWEHSALARILSRMTNRTRQVSVDDFVSSPTFLSWPFQDRLGQRGLDPVDVLEQNPPVYFQRNLENMVAIASEQGFEIVLATWAHSPYLDDYASLDHYQKGFEENNEVVKMVANSHQVALFDFAAVMPQDAVYWADGRHVNEAGALEKARLFADYIQAQGLIE